MGVAVVARGNIQQHFPDRTAFALLMLCCLGNVTVIIGASLSEPHTSESNGGIFIYYILSVVRRSVNASSLF